MTGQRRGFGVINSNVMRSPSVSLSAKALYSLLTTYADGDGVCWPSNETLAQALGTTDRTIRTLLAELQEKGVLIRESRFEQGRQTTSVNRLLDWSSVRGGEEAHFRPGEEADFRQKKTTGTISPSTDVEEEKVRSTESRERTRRMTVAEAQHFNTWWDLYPKKVGKQAAYRAWVKAIKDTDHDCIIAGLQAQVAVLSDKKKEGFCPDPATWLNAGRWDDEITPRRQPPRLEGETSDHYFMRTGVKWVKNG